MKKQGNYILYRMDKIDESLRLLRATVEQLRESFMATQVELTAQLVAINERLVKVGTETARLVATVNDLKTVVAAGPVSPELQAAVDAVAAQTGVVDDMVPDLEPVG